MTYYLANRRLQSSAKVATLFILTLQQARDSV
jgi:hypothetical protein